VIIRRRRRAVHVVALDSGEELRLPAERDRGSTRIAALSSGDRVRLSRGVQFAKRGGVGTYLGIFEVRT
jgi:hypothetical protein